MNYQNIVIAVAGGSGSGKTFFSGALHKKLGLDQSCILYQDSYYHDQSQSFDHDGGSVNFDHPSALDFDLLAKHLKDLKAGQNIDIPKYDFATHSRLQETTTVCPKKVIIVDGILIMGQPKLREIFDFSIFVETPEEIRFQRRLARDVLERGRTRDGVIAQFEKQVKPMHDRFVEPSKEHAMYLSSGTNMDLFNEFLNAIENKIEDTNHTLISKFKVINSCNDYVQNNL